nr:hypothetical protein [Tanacetum cinerariifolium]GFA12951.1 hypothetical protein [Tanacetum cinerariifolium]
VKTASRVSKPTLKRISYTNRSLLTKQEGGQRVEAHTWNLNKQNRVDSCVNFKHSGFVSKHFPVCNDCGECLFFGNHDACVLHYLKHENTKRSNVKNVVTHVRKVWRLVSKNAARTTSQWKPTGRTFSLYATYPLTRIVEPIVKPLKLTPCVSFNSKVTMISRFTDYKLSNRKAGSKGISGTDNRAPMLEENDYESWKIRIKRYIQSKPQGKAIWNSIVEGPAPHPMTTAITGVANVVVEAPRPKRDEEFTIKENARDLADIQAASILS